ncbi:MAG: hypothetical protein ACE3L7_14545 [Candidatus Pristimantibacillus sp.]
MIIRVSIQLNKSFICGGLAIVEREGQEECIYFDVVKGSVPKIIIGGRGKIISPEEADLLESELLTLFTKHKVPFTLVDCTISA